jgi:putative membrane protein
MGQTTGDEELKRTKRIGLEVPRAAAQRLTRGIAAVLGFASAEGVAPGADTMDVSTRLARQRTDLALERNYLADERTLMGWIRTALSMISFGFTIGKLGQALQEVEVRGLGGRAHTISVQSIAYFLVVLGCLSLLAATVQFRIRANELQAMGYRRKFSIAVMVAVLLTIVGGFAITALVTEL